jgi:cell division protein FtsB
VPVPAPRSPGGLTGRAAILGLVLCALVVSAAVPLREYLSQRSQITDVQSQQSAAAARVKALEDRQAQLQDPDQIAALARERLHFSKPGETTYVVITPSPAPAPTKDPGTVEANAGAPWFSQLWGSVQAADRPAATPPPSDETAGTKVDIH